MDLREELMREGDSETGWPRAWSPEREPVLIGTVTRYTLAPGKHGECKTCIVQRDDGSRVAVWQNSTVLVSLFNAEDPRPGERIGLRFLGRHPEKNYKRFKLIVDREETASPSPAPTPARATAAPFNGSQTAPGDDPFVDDDHPFGAEPFPPGYASTTMARPTTRTGARPLTIAPPRSAARR